MGVLDPVPGCSSLTTLVRTLALSALCREPHSDIVIMSAVQKAVRSGPSRPTKDHIDWSVGVFPGVLYISLPRRQ